MALTDSIYAAISDNEALRILLARGSITRFTSHTWRTAVVSAPVRYGRDLFSLAITGLEQ